MKNLRKMMILIISVICLLITPACEEKVSSTINLTSVTGSAVTPGAIVTLTNDNGNKANIYMQTAKGAAVDFKSVVIGSYTLTVEHDDFLPFTLPDLTVHSAVSGYTANLIERNLLVFFDKGSVSDGWRYLVAAPQNTEFEANWFTAVSQCKEINVNGITGWALPDKDQLNLMYTNLHKKGLGGFKDEFYWSSSQDSDDSGAWLQDLLNGSQSYTYYLKYNTFLVRAVRAF